MTDTVLLMAKSKKPGDGKAPRYPSRSKIKYAGLPREYWELLEGLTVDGAKFEGRSVAYLAKIAVRAFLRAEGLVDDKGKPVEGQKPGG